MKGSSPLFSFITVLVLANGCDNSFSPTGRYEPKLVVYSLLTATSDTQYVRVMRTVDPELYDRTKPLPEQDVTDAVVTITQGTTQYTFNDTLIDAKDTTGTMKKVKVYVNYGLTVESLKSYSLTVLSQSLGTISAISEGLEPGEIQNYPSSLFSVPNSGEFINLQYSLGRNVKASLFRLIVEYDAIIDGQWRAIKEEIPSYVETNSGGEIVQKLFPQIHYRGATVSASSQQNEVATFSTKAYLTYLLHIQDAYGRDNMRFKNVQLVLSQFDDNSYAYYSTVNGFVGGATIRLDEPDYSNIQGGFGIFGSLTEQRRTFTIPAHF